MKIGIDLGGTNVRVGVVDGGRIAEKIIEPTRSDASEEEVLNHLKQLIASVIHSGVEGIGIGVPSVVDAGRGIVYNVANIPSWQEVHLKTILENEFRLPVAVNNDCNCFALGEFHFGEGAAYRDLICVALGTGVGAGVIINGKLYMGNNTGAGEIGCLPYLEHDYEYYCGSRFLSEEHGMPGKEAFERGLAGDAVALKLWEEVGFHMGSLMKMILYTYDPQAIILGGSISNAFDFFSAKMYESMSNFPYPETLDRIRIQVSRKEDIALLGASALL
jgi:glucokinase